MAKDTKPPQTDEEDLLPNNGVLFPEVSRFKFHLSGYIRRHKSLEPDHIKSLISICMLDLARVSILIDETLLQRFLTFVHSCSIIAFKVGK